MTDEHADFETLVSSLRDEKTRAEYGAPYDRYHTSLIPRLFGFLLVGCGNLVYGFRPSYLKFRAVEVIARVPYHSWASASFTLLTMFYSDERRALRLMTISRFAAFAAENETMHVVVISKLARAHQCAGFFRHSFIPMLFAFVYFWGSYLLYFVNPRWSLELNYLFEHHAFEQYSRFLEEHGDHLRRCSIESEYLAAYGRQPRSEYEFFELVRNDELVHRNRSIREIEMHSHSLTSPRPAVIS